MRTIPAWRVLLLFTGLQASHIPIWQPAHVQVLRGSAVSLSCLFNHSLANEKKPFYRWVRVDAGQGTGLDVESNFTRTLIPDTNVSHFCVLAHFGSVTLAHSGTYSCEVAIPAPGRSSSGRGPGTKLHVHAPPSVSIAPSGQEVVLKGRMLTLSCKVSGYHPKGVGVTWLYPDKRTVTSGAKRSSEQLAPGLCFRMTSYLELHPRAADRRIRYSCQVNHSTLRSPITRDFDFVLKYGPTNQEVFWRSSPLGHFSPLARWHASAPVGSFLELRCVVESSPPSCVRWVDPNGTVRAEGLHSNATLTLDPLRAPDSGRYTCAASNAHWSREQDVQVEVLSPASLSARWVTYPLFTLAVTGMHLWSSCRPGARSRRPEGDDAHRPAAPAAGDACSWHATQALVE